MEQPIEREIAQVAFEKVLVDALAEEFKAHDARVKERFLEMTEGMDKAQKYSDVFGELCSLSKVKGKPSEKAVRCSLVEPEEALEWVDEQEPSTLGFALDNLEGFCKWHFEHTGECPPGFTVITYDTIPKPPSAKWGMKRGAPEKMFDILRDEYGFELDAAMPNLLEGGTDGA